MSSQSFSRGDRVRVTLEGEITRVMDIEPGSEEVELRVEHNGSASFVYTDMATVEKIELPVETFGEGSLIQQRGAPMFRYFIGKDGYYSFTLGRWFAFSESVTRASDFTSNRYEPAPAG